MYQEKLATCFREVLDNGGTIHLEPYGEPAPSPSPWPEQHEVGVWCHSSMQLHNQTFAINIWPEALSVETHCFLNDSRKCLKTNVI